jgi:mRNA-degrading endonuclease RelE of RelBE toxin-antitoxin system
MPQNEIRYGTGFLGDVRRLPVEAQRKLGKLLEILREDPFDTRLHTKSLAVPLHGMFSFRITRDWRVGFGFTGEHTVHLLVADHRRNIYKRLVRLQ